MRRVINSLSDVVTGTPAAGHEPLFHTSVGWKTVRSARIDIRAFGGVGDDSTDNTTAIVAANAAAAAYDGGGTIIFPDGVFQTDPFTLSYRVSLSGLSGKFPSNATGAVLKLRPNATSPLISNDQVNGGVAGASAIGGGSQHYQYSSIENLTFDGNVSNQTSMNADLIRLTSAWHVAIRNCAFIHAKGFGIRALDCNVINVFDNHFINAQIYLESLADSLIRGNQIGGGNGMIGPVMWLASGGEYAWQSIYAENFIFNNALATFPAATFDAGTDVAKTASAHGWVDDTPVVVTTTGVLPAGLTLGKTYYVKVTGDDTVKLATTRANREAGTYVDIADAGTGTHTIRVGLDCGLYLSDPETKWNILSQNRIDQNHGHGIVCEGIENDFTGNIINGNGLANATGQHGIHFQNGAVRNSVRGGVIDGTVYTSGGNSTNQVIGVYADSTSYDTRLDPSTHIRGHSTANVQLVGYTGSSEHLSLGTDRFEALSGSPVVGTVGGGRRNGWLFDASSDEIIGTEFWTPVGWRTLKIKLWWVNAGGGSGDVVWAANVGQFVAGESLDAADALSVGTTTTAGDQDILTMTTLSDVTIDEGKLVFLRIKRTGTAGGDTLANDAALIAVRVERG